MKGEFKKDLIQQNILLHEINKELKSKTLVFGNNHQYLEIPKNAKTHQFINNRENNHKLQTHKKTLQIIVVSVLVFAASMTAATSKSTDESTKTGIITGNYVVENLRGDIQATWKVWKIDPKTELVVNIQNSDLLTVEQRDTIKNTIMSENTENIDNSFLHKGPKGTSSTYYFGWTGALLEASKTNTVYTIPTKFRITESNTEQGNIIIHVTKLTSGDGYSGFTKSVVDGNQILKSDITIYGIDSLSLADLETIVRHEFGHALGLGHSTATEDLMAPIITTPITMISPCNIDGITALYNGKTMDMEVCKI